MPPILAAVIGCGAPEAPEIPGRDEIGPPPEAALPGDCLPPYPMRFGDDWYLLADLDRGVACYAYLERDECVVGIFDDCTDDSTDRRQWRGRLEQDEDGAKARLSTDYPPGSGSRVPRSPACCSGGVHTEGDDAWALLSCQIDQCGAVNDVAHAGLYLSRYDREADPSAAIGPIHTVPSGASALAYEPASATLWGVTPTALFTLDPSSGATETKVALTAGGALAAGHGYVYAADGPRLVIASAATPPRTIELPGNVRAIAATATAAIVAVSAAGAEQLWRVDASSGARTATAAIAGPVSGLQGDNPTFITLEGATTVYAAQTNLAVRPFFDTVEATSQTGGSFVPRAPQASPLGVGVLGGCDITSSKQHCLFVSTGDGGRPRRHAIAGVQRLIAGLYSDSEQAWIAISEGGRITEVDAVTGRLHLQRQVRLENPLRAAAYDDAGHRAFVLHRDLPEVTVIDLAALQ